VHPHDFKTCSCGKTSIDGGTDYLRRVGHHWAEMSELAPNPTLSDKLPKTKTE
jgi:hypothetical protein